ncbi:hypothetical protein [Pleionea sp. CnH1-48]|uniref:hypothetical protein n=1 Tax=Pleionea sp. CnH1-48 TaxID=2954494 RepID=UPI002096DA9C|nr:hypothetical protein [Pleionea sp. CnH1-48]MCO7224303.1 hypothetical protein [Pleionea sp. CnH1-48]
MGTLGLILHIATGTIAVFAGILGLLTKKGGRLHRKAGNVFFITMLIQAFMGFVLAMVDSFMITAMAGIFTCYLVATAWSVVRSAPGSLSVFDYVAPVFALLVFGVCGFLGLEAQSSNSGTLRGISYEYYYFFATMALVAGGLDIRMLLTKGVVGGHRIARHLWRMCFALYLSLGSFVEQSADRIPKVFYDYGLGNLPDIVLLLMLFFLASVFYQSYKRNKVAKNSHPTNL